MKKYKALKIRIDLEHAALQGDDRAPEVDRILRSCADRLKNGETSGTLRDINGNTTGFFSHILDEGAG